jgi:hypothetical protein
MQSRSASSSLLIYFGAAAAALSVVVLGLTAVVKAATGWSQANAREKTVLELQVESSRDIRRALATPPLTSPLPPITARPAHALRDTPPARTTAAVQDKKPARPKLPPAAMNAMAMDQSGAYRSAAAAANYAVPDRHAAY